MSGNRQNLLEFRKKRDMTQQEFADVMGVERTRYQNIEAGNREGTMEFWQKLQAAFSVPDEELWHLTQKKA